jgi:hypothetical protein
MKNKKLMNIATYISTLILLSSISVSSYAMSHKVAKPAMKDLAKTEIYSINSKAANLSNISIIKRKNGYAISGNVHINIMQRRVLKIPGSVSIELKNSKGKILETSNARLHRKYGKSKTAHFDGVLKTTPPTGSTIIITHHN